MLVQYNPNFSCNSNPTVSALSKWLIIQHEYMLLRRACSKGLQLCFERIIDVVFNKI